MSDRKVPLAYVTKWAATKGILVVRDAETYSEGKYLTKGALFVWPKDWTEDKEYAEERYRAALKRKAAAALAQVGRLEAAALATPKYEEFDR